MPEATGGRTEEIVAECPPCAGTGEFPPDEERTCGWCGGDGEVPAEIAGSLWAARRNYQARKGGAAMRAEHCHHGLTTGRRGSADERCLECGQLANPFLVFARDVLIPARRAKATEADRG